MPHFLCLSWLQLVHTSALLHSDSHWTLITTLFGARAAAEGVAISNFQGPVARGLVSSLPDRKSTSLVVEFGCYSLTTVLDSLLSRHEVAGAGGERFDGLCYPDAADWRDLVWEGAAEILRLGFRSIDRTTLRAERPAEP